MGCMCLHINKEEDHFYTLNAHFIFAKFWTVLHMSKRVVVVLVYQIDAVQCT